MNYLSCSKIQGVLSVPEHLDMFFIELKYLAYTIPTPNVLNYYLCFLMKDNTVSPHFETSLNDMTAFNADQLSNFDRSRLQKLKPLIWGKLKVVIPSILRATLT